MIDRKYSLAFRAFGHATVLLSALASLTLANPHEQVKQENWQRLLTMNQRFENYKSDFIEFGRSPQAKRSRNSEDIIDVHLVMTADQTVSHLEYIEAMVAIYLKVSNKQDRLAIWPLITDQIATTKKRLEQQVQLTNAQIPLLRTPGVVAEAMRMRDDLRNVEENLEGAMNEIEAAEARLP